MHRIEIRSKRAKRIESIDGSLFVVDVTSRAQGPWVKFSPFFPHGLIPIPFSEGVFGESVEGIWQGLKVFQNEGIDLAAFANDSMKGIKRGGGIRGRVLGHQKGTRSGMLLSYADARHEIYIPTFRWVLQNRLQAEVDQLRALFVQKDLILLDYNTNTDSTDLSKPLFHAALIREHLLLRV